MKRRLLPFLLAGALTAAIAAPVSAQPNQSVQNALIGLVVQAVVRDVTVVDINDSFNNLLQNADINVEVIEDSLNNNRVLNNLDITVTDVRLVEVGDDIIITVDVLSGPDIIIS